MLSATFIVFSALSMGVSERQRTLAMLRAVGARRAQVAGLVVFEGMLLALLGSGGGRAAGMALDPSAGLEIQSDVFVAGVVMSPGGMLVGAGGSLLAAVAASLLPAWSASRVSPLEAMTPQSSPPSARLPIVCAIVGLVLDLRSIRCCFLGRSHSGMASAGIGHASDGARIVQFYGHFTLGLPAMMIGFFLLSPVFVWAVERIIGPLRCRDAGRSFFDAPPAAQRRCLARGGDRHGAHGRPGHAGRSPGAGAQHA